MDFSDLILWKLLHDSISRRNEEVTPRRYIRRESSGGYYRNELTKHYGTRHSEDARHRLVDLWLFSKIFGNRD